MLPWGSKTKMIWYSEPVLNYPFKLEYPNLSTWWEEYEWLIFPLHLATHVWQLSLPVIASSIDFINNIAKWTVKFQICQLLCIWFSLHPLRCNCVKSLNSTLRSVVKSSVRESLRALVFCTRFACKTRAQNRIQGGRHLHEWWVIYAFLRIAGRVNCVSVCFMTYNVHVQIFFLLQFRNCVRPPTTYIVTPF